MDGSGAPALRTPVPAPAGAAPLVGPTGAARARIILQLGSLIAIAPLTIDMYLPALPAITDDLHTIEAQVQLTLTGTLLGLGLGQLLIGPLSDSYGRRLPMLAGLGLHVLSSLACVIAPGIGALGVLRVLQGVGTAAALVVAMAIVRDLFTGRAAATIISRLMLVMGAAPILAPSLGGVVLLAGSWRWVFGALAIIGAVLMVVAAVSLPETLPVRRRRRAGLRPVLAAYRGLLRDGEFMVLGLVAGLAMSALFSYVSGSSFVFQHAYGLDQQTFGIVFGLGAFSLIGASQVNVALLRRYDPRTIVTSALSAATGFGVIMIATGLTGAGGLPAFLAPLWGLLAAMGLVLPNAPALALTRHGEAAGTAAAMLGAGQFGLGAAIAPVVGLLGNDAPAMAYAMTGGAGIALLALLCTPRSRPTE
jgi:DHA1 family bicyclomycin/chloramphenicol resistance-like MFS transporter